MRALWESINKKNFFHEIKTLAQDSYVLSKIRKLEKYISEKREPEKKFSLSVDGMSKQDSKKTVESAVLNSDIPKEFLVQYQKIKKAGLFDENYYLFKYPDVRKSGMDPLLHFIKYGEAEGRNPNIYFDVGYYKRNNPVYNKGVNSLIDFIDIGSVQGFKTSPFFDAGYYLDEYQDVKKAGVNPLLHYLRHGEREGRQSVPSNSRQKADVLLPKNHGASNGIAVIIPVFNAPNEVADCINSVLQNTSLSKNELIIIDDASTDPTISTILDRYSSCFGVRIFQNERNLGYTKTINKGIKLAGDRDIVLLNSDTVVPKFWLRNLEISAYRDTTIGTVTAVSNNAGAFSVPIPGTNRIPEGMSISEMARLVSNVNELDVIEVPTGNGFCLYIKRELISEIGNFDEVAFPRGYGEENEFCMRAGEAGWSNIVDSKTYVYHVRSASFREEKGRLIELGMNNVENLHPIYPYTIKSVGNKSSFKLARKRVSRGLEAWKKGESKTLPRVMFVISTRTGGTPQTNKDLMEGISDIYDPIAVVCDRRRIEVLTVEGGEYKCVDQYTLTDHIDFASHKSREYDAIIQTILYKYSVELVHIRHIAWHSLNLPSVARKLDIPVVFSLHDFYTVCPSVNLIDNEGVYHQKGVADNGSNPLWNDETSTILNSSLLEWWQRRMDRMLSQCDLFITTCQSAKNILRESLPELESRITDFMVIPHGRDFTEFMDLAVAPTDSRPLKVLLPGNISKSKGSELVKRICELDSDGLIEFHVLGACAEDLKKYVVFHGEYKRENFSQHVKKIQPNIAAVLSIWPETYCHTLTESWSVGLPVFGLDFGAVGERIKKNSAGWLCDSNPKNILERLYEIRLNRNDFNLKVSSVKRWQSEEGQHNTVKHMASKYIEAYRFLRAPGYQAVELGCKPKIAAILKGSFPFVPPTAYVRIVDQIPVLEETLGGDIVISSYAKILREGLAHFSKVLVQRDAVPEHLVDALIEVVNDSSVELIIELDDDLLSVPESKDRDGVYKRYSPALMKLITSADGIHVSTDFLKHKFYSYNKNIRVIPNKISHKRWFSDIPCQLDETTRSRILSVPSSYFKIIYMGSKTHDEDLHLLITALDRLSLSNFKFKVFIVGVADSKFELPEYCIRLIPPDGRYDNFVNWIRGVSKHADIGVAPLVESEFNARKTALKIMEYAAMGLPLLASNVSPYKEFLKEHQSLLVDNDIVSWVRAIETIAARGTQHTSNVSSVKSLLKENLVD